MDTRTRVLKTALHLFTVKGYFNTSIHDIRRESDVSIGSIYHYFKSKEAIARALYDAVLEQMNNVVDDVMERQADTKERCRALMQYMLKQTEEDPETMHFVLYVRHREFIDLEKPICSSEPFEKMRLIVEDGMLKGDIRKMDGWVAAASLFGGTVRIIQLKLDNAIDGSLNDYFDELWEAGWAAVAAR